MNDNKLNEPISTLTEYGLSHRTLELLETKANYTLVGHLQRATSESLSQIRQIGPESINEIRNSLRDYLTAKHPLNQDRDCVTVTDTIIRDLFKGNMIRAKFHDSATGTIRSIILKPSFSSQEIIKELITSVESSTIPSEEDKVAAVGHVLNQLHQQETLSDDLPSAQEDDLNAQYTPRHVIEEYEELEDSEDSDSQELQDSSDTDIFVASEDDHLDSKEN